MAWDRLGADDDETAAAQRRHVRGMFDFADGTGCRHVAVCRHFGEAVEPCGDACDGCTGEDPLAALPPKPRTARARRERGRSRGAPRAELAAEEDLALFERLRAWRAEVARDEGVPAFVVLSDATLAEIALARPRTDEALLAVNGIGPRKLEAFGDAILRLVRKGQG
jgi:ATP-dependent DNA helicase RecQ